MWKCATRRVKSVFCKCNSNSNNITWTRSARNDHKVNSQLRLTPTLFGSFNGAYGHRRTHNCGEFSGDGRSKKEDTKTHKGYCLHDLHDDIFGALRLSGIFVLGWYLLQPFSHRKTLLGSQSDGKCTLAILTEFTNIQYHKLINYLRGGVSPFNCILPEVKADRSKKQLDNESREEALNFDELERAHKKVLGAISNQLGAECMQGGRFSEAFTHFNEGAQMNNAAAIYNLGLCHEMGFGTNTDSKKAAEMYRKASEMGHPTAMYNLGVFYARGLGDLKQDFIEARKLFTLAAKLGQRNAKLALDMENGVKSDSPEERTFAEKLTTPLQVASKIGVRATSEMLPKINLLKRLFGSGMDKTEVEEEERTSSEDSGAADLSPRHGVLLT